MGCHTWFYTKIQRTEEEARKIWIDHQKQLIKEWTERVNCPVNELRVALEYSQEYCEHLLELYNRQLRMVEKGLCTYAVWNKQPDDEEYSLYEFVPNKGLFATNDILPHDIFRIGGYPEDRLFSFEETLNYLNQKEILLTEKEVLRLKKFWVEHPDGMIVFG